MKIQGIIDTLIVWCAKIFQVRPQTLLLLVSDAVAMQLSVMAVFALRWLWSPVEPELYLTIAALLLLEPVFSLVLGTCQRLSLPIHKEVKQLFIAVSLAYLVVLSALFMSQMTLSFSRLIIFGAWAVSIVAVPLLRGRVRRAFSSRPWWTSPVIFLQSREEVAPLWDSLSARPQRGLKPVAAVDVSNTDDLEDAVRPLLQTYPNAVGIMLLEGDDTQLQTRRIKKASKLFKSLLLVPHITMGDNRIWLTPRDLEGAVGLMVRQNLLDSRRLRFKRWMDVSLTMLGGVLILPLVGVIALCIKLDSKGPVFYKQVRLGQKGQSFNVFKFRTMECDAEQKLEQHLRENPELRDEWEKEQKLKNDPRVTRMGRWLRKTSLDELPQLWNVLCGNMSLVGPRPIVENEVDRYGRVYKEYLLVKPGITGLWQVSGRNNTSYIERIRYDHYYVTNWSIWMDLWILARTIPVVIRGNGAY